MGSWTPNLGLGSWGGAGWELQVYRTRRGVLAVPTPAPSVSSSGPHRPLLRMCPGVSVRVSVTAWRSESWQQAHSLSPPRPRAQAPPAPGLRPPPGRKLPGHAQRPLLCMDGAVFWVMKYSQVSDSLRNDGDQSIPFQEVIFFSFTASVSC